MVADPLDLLADMLEAGIRAHGSAWRPEPYQVPPEVWDVWGLIGGRGIGKSDAGAHQFVEHVRGPACLSGRTPHRLSIIAPTLGDAVESCWKAPAGISVHDPTARLVTTKGGTIIRWPNGSEAKVFGTEGPRDVERLRAGGNRCFVWAEELAAWAYLEEAWEQMQFGLRLGPHPRVIVTTTPKPRKAYKTIVSAPGFVRALTEDGRVPTTDDNPHLSPERRAELYRLYGGRRIGRQELGGELIEDVEGAYWSWEDLERLRVKKAPPLTRIVVAVDPATTADADSDETGIGAAGKITVLPVVADDDGNLDQASTVARRYCCAHPGHAAAHPRDAVHYHYFVLEDASLRASPSGWATVAIEVFGRWAADRIIAEVNNGGDMVISTIRAVNREVPVKKITASRGKAVRAEPVSGLYEQCLVHHVGSFPELEEQQTTFPISNEHDDRVDWVVYAITELSISGVAFRAGTVQHGRPSGDRAPRRGGRQDGYRNPRGD